MPRPSSCTTIMKSSSSRWTSARSKYGLMFYLQITMNFCFAKWCHLIFISMITLYSSVTFYNYVKSLQYLLVLVKLIIHNKEVEVVTFVTLFFKLNRILYCASVPEKDGWSRIPRRPMFRSRRSVNVLKLLQVQPAWSWGRRHGKKTTGVIFIDIFFCYKVIKAPESIKHWNQNIL